MATQSLTEGTQAILDEFAVMRGLSKRALAEMRKSLAEGSDHWVSTLSTKSAAESQPRRSPGLVRAPRPSGRIAPINLARQPCRRPKQFIARQTNNYERDQYIRSELLKDARAQRIEDQLLFEYGKDGLKEMRRSQVEKMHDPVQTEDNNADRFQTPRDALVEQIFKEIDERLQFQHEMESIRGARESCRIVRLEVAQRINELARLGVDVSAARPPASVGVRSSLNAQQERTQDGNLP